MVCAKESQFEVIHGLIDNIMAKLNCQPKILYNPNSKKKVYELVEHHDEAFIDGESAYMKILCPNL